jgi:hypothetical protein
MVSDDKVTHDEILGKGIEDIKDPIDVIRLFNAMIYALPEATRRDQIHGILDDCWSGCRGDI